MSNETIPFAKMHGIGNDFVVLGPDVARRSLDWSRLARAICDRRFGIGSDGMIVVDESLAADFQMRMFNPDGSEAEMCGNGIRCFAKFLYDEGMAQSGALSIQTGAGLQRVRLLLERDSVKEVEVDMGLPEFRAERIPVLSETQEVVDRPLRVDGVNLVISCVSMGNPHAIAFVNDVDAFPLERIGPLVEHHAWFPRRTNFEICQVVDQRHLAMRVWERGAGMTLACGTGASAVMAVAFRHGLVDPVVDILLPGGHLTLAWDGQGSVMMTGPATFVFHGDWPL